MRGAGCKVFLGRKLVDLASMGRVKSWTRHICMEPGIDVPSVNAQTSQDSQQLKVLQLCHYALAGLSCLCWGGYLAVFYARWQMDKSQMQFFEADPEFPRFQHDPASSTGLILIGAAALFMILLFPTLLAISGVCLGRRKGYVFVLIASFLNFFWVPLGTVLGIFTVIVLQRPSVKALFGRPAA